MLGHDYQEILLASRLLIPIANTVLEETFWYTAWKTKQYNPEDIHEQSHGLDCMQLRILL